MAAKPNEEELIRRYLVGDLPNHEVEEIERRVMLEDEFADRVQLVEESLVEDYIDGKLELSDARNFERLLLSTKQGSEEICIVKALGEYSGRTDTSDRVAVPQQSRRRWRRARLGQSKLRAAAAALIVIAVGVAYWAIWRKPTENHQRGTAFLSTAFSRMRPLESRITVLRGYAPRPTTRGGEDVPRDPVMLARAELILVYNAKANPNSKSFQELGCYYLARREFAPAIQWIERALELDLGSAAAYCDLGTAYFEKAKQQDILGNESGGLLLSLKEYDTALKLNGDLEDALFNRALVLVRLSRNWEAAAAWEAYLKRDSTSGWAVEARKNLEDIRR